MSQQKEFWVKMPVKGKLTSMDWAVIHFKVALASILIVITVLAPGASLQRLTGSWMYWFWVVTVLAGSATSIVGLIMGSRVGRVRRTGMIVEMVGLWGCWTGPAVLSVLLFTKMALGDFSLPALVFGLMAYTISAALLVRIFQVRGAARRKVRCTEVPE